MNPLEHMEKGKPNRLYLSIPNLFFFNLCLNLLEIALVYICVAHSGVKVHGHCETCHLWFVFRVF